MERIAKELSEIEKEKNRQEIIQYKINYCNIQIKENQVSIDDYYGRIAKLEVEQDILHDLKKRYEGAL